MSKLSDLQAALSKNKAQTSKTASFQPVKSAPKMSELQILQSALSNNDQDVIRQYAPIPTPGIVEAGATGARIAQNLSNSAKQRNYQNVMQDPTQAAKMQAALLGVPFTAATAENLQTLNEQATRAADVYGLDSPQVAALIGRRRDLQASQKHVEDVYMAQPAKLTESERQARELQQAVKTSTGVQKRQFQKQYDALVNSEQYIKDNWEHWLGLAQSGKTLTTDEREEAKMAAAALGQAADKLYWSHGDPTLLTREEVRQYNTLTGLSGALESKESGVEATILGAANMIPVDKIGKVLRENIPVFGEYQDSLYSDRNVAELMAKSNLSENAQAAHPGLYLAGNLAGNAALTAAGGGALRGLGIASQAARDAIMFGTLGTVSSAANQDWSAPGKATLNTALGGGLGALGGYLGGKAAETAGAYLDQWARVKGGNQLPEYRPRLASNKGEGYNGNWERAYETVKGLEKSAENSAEGAGNDAYNAYLKMLDELEAARKSGMTAREFAMSKGVPSSLTDKEAALLDKYNLRMYTEGAGEYSGKPYSTGRPKYGRTQVDDVWNAHANPETDTVTDPSGATIVWDRTKPRNGQWDMGHIPGQKYSDTHASYMNGELSLDEFLKWYRNPQNYRPELPGTNRSHLYEDNWHT